MKRTALLSLLLLATVIDGCATTGTPTNDALAVALAQSAGGAAGVRYIASHPGNVDLVLTRLAQAQAVLDAEKPLSALRSVALDALTDPRDALIIEPLLALIPDNGKPIAKGSTPALIAQAIINGVKGGVVAQAAAGGGR